MKSYSRYGLDNQHQVHSPVLLALVTDANIRVLHPNCLLFKRHRHLKRGRSKLFCQLIPLKGTSAATGGRHIGRAFRICWGTGEMFRFPKYSIVELLPPSEAMAYFLIVRKGSIADSRSYDPQLDYYEPVLLKLYSGQESKFEALSNLVAPPAEVQRHMDYVKDNTTRAEFVLLSMIPLRKYISPRLQSTTRLTRVDQLSVLHSTKSTKPRSS
ncbi:hypothetical protein DL95DRAFT_501364 [Leptodontidium sp. 2 PMI_412]|nr:hypothetical protein DL95DRAFT_501364 [Leptodontidium sp. 2 PMI_412]